MIKHCLNCEHCRVDVVGLYCENKPDEYVKADDCCAFWEANEEEEEDG